MSDRREFTITKLECTPEGYWQANITVDGTTVRVNRRYGSWQLLDGEQARIVLPHVARALQARVRPLERAKRQQEEQTA